MNIFFVGLLLGLPRTVCAVGPGAISAGLRENTLTLQVGFCVDS